MFNLKEGIISITNRCNLHCKMCDIPVQGLEELSTFQWREIINDIAFLGAQTVVFSGGEPLLRTDLLELILFAKNKGLKVCLTSNGILINDNLAKDLSRVGVDVVNISVDGPKEVHDYFRGEGKFDKALEALKCLKNNNIEITIATMVCKYNYNYLSFVVSLAVELGATTIKFQPFSTLFLKDKNDHADFFLDSAEAEALGGVIKEVYRQCNEYGIATNPRDYLEKLPFYLSNKLPIKSKSCPALYLSLPLNAKGEFYPCWVKTNKNYLIADLSIGKLVNVWGGKRHKHIIKNILRNGCSGCAMSCYDSNFGLDQLTDRAIKNIGVLRREGLFVFAGNFYRKLLRRVSFYSSYRGSAFGLIRRISKVFIKKPQIRVEEFDKFAKALNEIHIAIKILKKEIELRK